MNIIQAQNLACPIDDEPLEYREKQLVCTQGHSFDIARQGYVNLLPVQHKRSKHPGDSKEMVQARTQFLNTGVYSPIAEQLSEIVVALTAGNVSNCIVDAGCGEGYYLDYMCHYLQHKNQAGDTALVGLDISRDAIVEAARRNKNISWLVGTNRQPPLLAGSVDIIVCVFGFHSFEGFKKILKPGGWVVLVEPGIDHLQELRAIIYKEVKKSAPPSLGAAEQLGFSLQDTRELCFNASINDRQQINNLLLMTPHFYRADKQGREKASSLTQLDVSVDIVFRVLQKTAERQE